MSKMTSTQPIPESEVIEMMARAMCPIRADANAYGLKRPKVMAIDLMLAKAALDALSRQGLRAVPREPTEAMIEAGLRYVRAENDALGWAYEAMLAESGAGA